jgi:hypothetical protein
VLEEANMYGARMKLVRKSQTRPASGRIDLALALAMLSKSVRVHGARARATPLVVVHATAGRNPAA